MKTKEGIAKMTLAVPAKLLLRSAVLIMLAWAGFARAANAQQIAVQIDSGAPVNVSAADIAAMPHQKLTVDAHGRALPMKAFPCAWRWKRRE